ncbi:autophagocytosis associated protein [Gongronella butleri]|nr:autophagocytosis associated protein [Gongronella butleri]
MVSLSRSLFDQAINLFYERHGKVDWVLKEAPITGYTYLQSTHHLTTHKQDEQQEIQGLQHEAGEEEWISEHHDDPAEASTPMAPPLLMTIDYHIVFSPSYQVPVLYFDAFFTDGRRLSLDEIYTHVVPHMYQEEMQRSPIQAQGAITQADHPVVGRPFWYIHPCDTQTLLRTLQPCTIDVYIQTWLSLVAPVVQCPTRLDWFIDTPSIPSVHSSG